MMRLVPWHRLGLNDLGGHFQPKFLAQPQPCPAVGTGELGFPAQTPKAVEFGAPSPFPRGWGTSRVFQGFPCVSQEQLGPSFLRQERVSHSWAPQGERSFLIS